MDSLDIFTARDLRNRAGGVLRQAEQGGMSLITKHGRPMALAIPFDGALLEQGVHRRLAVRLFAERAVTLAQAARIAGMTAEEVLGQLQLSGLDAVDYPSDEVQGELEGVE